VWGRVDGVPCALGSAAFLAGLGWPVPPALAAGAEEGSSSFTGWDGQARARLDFEATPIAGAEHVMRSLRERGLRTLVLSGDGAAAVERLAARLGVRYWQAGMGPEAKADFLGNWSREHGAIAMVGDGLNDGPVLAAAAVGIAAGAATDLARESADIVLPSHGLALLPWLLDEAQRLRRSIRANLLWAFGYNAVGLVLAATGLLQPVLAAALMAGSSLSVAGRSWLAQRRAASADQAAPAAAGEPLPG
jgi:Cu2+-exporting ATPase